MMDLNEQLCIVARAVNTLETLRDHDAIEDDDSIATMFAKESWGDLKRLAEHLKAQGATITLLDHGVTI